MNNNTVSCWLFSYEYVHAKWQPIKDFAIKSELFREFYIYNVVKSDEVGIYTDQHFFIYTTKIRETKPKLRKVLINR